MYFDESGISCGVHTITDVYTLNSRTRFSKIKDTLMTEIVEEYGRREDIGNGGGTRQNKSKMGFMFSDVKRRGRGGAKLAQHLARLGTVVESPEFINYNTGSKIAAWIFVPSDEFMTECKNEVARLNKEEEERREKWELERAKLLASGRYAI